MSVPVKRVLIWSAAVAAGGNALFPVAEYVAVSSWGSDWLLWLALLLAFPIVLAVVVVPVALVMYLGGARTVAPRVIAAALVYFTIAVGLIHAGGLVRMQGFKTLAQRSERLVSAIRDFERSNGRPPTTLHELVPGFLSTVPKTGMAAYPEYELVVAEDARRQFDGNPWALLVRTPSGGINWDIFIYYPRQNYPSRGHGGWIERVGTWGYVHE